MGKEIGRTPLRLDALLLLELPLLLQFAKFVALVTALSMVDQNCPELVDITTNYTIVEQPDVILSDVRFGITSG